MKQIVMFSALFLLAAAAQIAVPTGGSHAGEKQSDNGGNSMNMTITSSAFEPKQKIPMQYTCDGADMSPPLTWTKGPEDTKSYALIADDPDAPMGTWVHWVMYNIPPNITSLPEDVPAEEQLDSGALQGITDFKRIGYGGPCPPSGTHRYFFKLYALDSMLEAKPGLTKEQLLEKMDGHILAEGELVGTYSR